MLEQNYNLDKVNDAISFVTIKIFARTELGRHQFHVLLGFVTIKIFARTEQKHVKTIVDFVLLP